MDKKPWYKSRTIWFNLALGILGLFQSITGVKVVDETTLGTVGAAGNVLLRTVTDKPVG